MPLTKLDAVTALIVVDLQQGMVGLPCVHRFAEIVGRAAQLARAFRVRRLPVALINVAGRPPGRTDAVASKLAFPPHWTDLLPELEPQPDDILITKHRVGAFIGTTLEDQLRRRGVTQVVLTGVSTGAGVEATARSAHDFGYHVTLVTDAMTDLNADAHRFMVEQLFPRIGETATTEDVLQILARESPSEFRPF